MVARNTEGQVSTEVETTPNVLISAMMPMAHVEDIAASLAFYRMLGFEVVNSVTPDGAPVPTWALLRSGRAKIMLAKASEPVIAEQQAVLFYAYSADVQATYSALESKGLKPAPIAKPFYNPGGEFRVTDPDGYVIYIAQI
jgi:catechol 2,3-dioxygenase-like lactoylglutathione lyase family enzyme